MPPPDPSFEPENAFLIRLAYIEALFRAGASTTILLETALDAAISLTAARFGNVQLLDQRTGALEMVVHRGFGDRYLDFFAVVQGDGTACATALRHRRATLVADVRTDPHCRGKRRAVLLEAGICAVQSTPLITTAGTVVGMLSTHYDEPTTPSDRALALLARGGQQLADYIEERH
jgi:GAF domain-containing protein